MLALLKEFTNKGELHTIKHLTIKEKDQIQDLCQRCSDYSILAQGHPPDNEAWKDILYDLPPGKDLTDKYILGLYNID